MCLVGMGLTISMSVVCWSTDDPARTETLATAGDYPAVVLRLAAGISGLLGALHPFWGVFGVAHASYSTSAL